MSADRMHPQRAERGHFLSSVRHGVRSVSELLHLLESLPCVIWTASVGGEGEWFSQQWRELTGHRDDAGRGHSWLSALHPDDVENFRQAWRHAEEAQVPYENEVRIVTPAGDSQWHLVRAVPLFGADDQISSWFLAALDIDPQTESIGTDLRAIVESTGVGIVTTDEQWTIISFNPAAQRLFGYSANRMSGEDVFALFDQYPRNELMQQFHEAAEHSEEAQRIVRSLSAKCENGRMMHVDVTVSKADYQHRRMYGLIIHDSTERIQAADAIREQEERLRAILESAVDAIVTIDQRGAINSVNPAAEKMFGYRADELFGQNVSMLMPTPYKEEHDGYMEHYRQTGQKKIIGIGRQVEAQRADGSTFPIFLSVGEMKIGEEVYYTGIIRDVTDVQDAQAKAVRNARLAALGEGITRLAHESRNFLQRIQTAAETTLLDASDSQREPLARIESACEGLHQLLEEVRSYAAPIQLDIRRVAIEEVWREALAVVREHGNQIVVREVLPPDLPELQADRFRLVQVFRNVLENSIAASDGTAEVTIRVKQVAAPEDEPRQWLSIEVADNGPGLTSLQRERVFDAFFTTKPRGTGLGLAIARRTLEAHDGSIDTPDHDGRGALFRLLLPVDGPAGHTEHRGYVVD